MIAIPVKGAVQYKCNKPVVDMHINCYIGCMIGSFAWRLSSLSSAPDFKISLWLVYRWPYGLFFSSKSLSRLFCSDFFRFRIRQYRNESFRNSTIGIKNRGIRKLMIEMSYSVGRKWVEVGARLEEQDQKMNWGGEKSRE